MADARSVGREQEAVKQGATIDAGIVNVFLGHFVDVLGADAGHFVDTTVSQAHFDSVYQAALVRDEIQLTGYESSEFLDACSETQLPLTAAGALAAAGKFEEAELLCRHGANKMLMYVGAASGGQVAYLNKNREWRCKPCSTQSAVCGAITLVAAYGKHKAVLDLFGSDLYYHCVVRGASMGGHFNFVEELMLQPSTDLDAVTGLYRPAVDRLRAELQHAADGLHFLTQFVSDDFRAGMARRLDSVSFSTQAAPIMLPYKMSGLVAKANQIRKLMDKNSLSYDDALNKVNNDRWWTPVSVAAQSIFAVGSAAAAAVAIILEDEKKAFNKAFDK